MATASIITLFYDELCGESMTSDTEVEWSSCEIVDGLGSTKSTYYMCTEPVNVWFAHREDPYSSPERVDPDRLKMHAQHYIDVAEGEFRRTSLLVDNMRAHSQTFYDGRRFEPWEYASAVEFRRMQETSRKVSGHGIRYIAMSDDVARSFLCLSSTDSVTLCENAAEVFYANKLEEKLAAQ